MDSTRCSPVGPRSRSSTSSRTRTSPAPATRSAGRTSRSCSTPGIDVISTLNIQHLESLNDVVEQITGIKQRETIPDEVVRRADQLELVDLAVETIRARHRARQHLPGRADRRRARQLLPARQPRRAARARPALDRRPRRRGPRRSTAPGTGSSSRGRRASASLVALTGSADGERLIRRAARMAQRSNGDLVAVHVVPQDGLAAVRRDAARRSSAGSSSSSAATYSEVVGADVGQALVDAARSLNATQIVIGATRQVALARADAGVGDQPRDRELRHRPRRARDQPRGGRRGDRARRGRASGGRRRCHGGGCCSASCSLRSACRCSTWVLVAPARARRSAERPAPVPPPRHRRLGRRRALAGVGRRGRAASCSSTGTSRRPSTRSRSARARTSSRSSSSSPSPGSSAASSPWRRVGRRRARVPVPRPRRSPASRARPRSTRCSRACGGRSVSTPRGVLHRIDDGWRLDAASGPAPSVARRRRRRRSRSTRRMCSSSNGGRRSGADDRPILQAYARELAASLQLEELEAAASTAGSLGGRERAPDRAALGRLARPAHAARGDQGVGDEPASGRRGLDRGGARTSSSPRSTRRPTASTRLVGNLLDMSRLQTGSRRASRAADQPRRGHPCGTPQPRPTRRRGRSRLAGGRAARQRRRRPARACARQHPRERRRPIRLMRPRRASPPAPSTAASTSGSSTAAPAFPRTSATGCSCRSNDSATRAAKASGSGLAVARGFIEAMNGSVELEDTPGGGLTVVVRLEAAR